MDLLGVLVDVLCWFLQLEIERVRGICTVLYCTALYIRRVFFFFFVQKLLRKLIVINQRNCKRITCFDFKR